jgi:hypothetical protein
MYSKELVVLIFEMGTQPRGLHGDVTYLLCSFFMEESSLGTGTINKNQLSISKNGVLLPN